MVVIQGCWELRSTSVGKKKRQTKNCMAAFHTHPRKSKNEYSVLQDTVSEARKKLHLASSYGHPTWPQETRTASSNLCRCSGQRHRPDKRGAWNYHEGQKCLESHHRNPTEVDLVSEWNRGITAGVGRGQSAPDTSHRDISPDLPGKERQRNRENGEEKKENRNWEGGKLKMKGGKLQNEERTYFFFFSLFKTTEICFGSTKIGLFSTGKSISRREKINLLRLCLWTP